MASLKAIARLAGSGGGVSTLNGLSGTLSLTSAGGTIAITPSGSTINLESSGGPTLPLSLANGGWGITNTRTNISIGGAVNNQAVASTWLNFTTTASSAISGFVAQADGTEIVISNSGSTFNLQLAGQSASSTAANRIIPPSAYSNYTIYPGQAASLRYDGGVSRWRVVGLVDVSSGSSGAINFADGQGGWGSDGGNFFYDKSQTRMQIPSIFVTSELDVGGAFRFLPAINDGAIPFFETSGSIPGFMNVDPANNLFWDKINKRLGIGTTTPGYRLSSVAPINTIPDPSSFTATLTLESLITPGADSLSLIYGPLDSPGDAGSAETGGSGYTNNDNVSAVVYAYFTTGGVYYTSPSGLVLPTINLVNNPAAIQWQWQSATNSDGSPVEGYVIVITDNTTSTTYSYDAGNTTGYFDNNVGGTVTYTPFTGFPSSFQTLTYDLNAAGVSPSGNAYYNDNGGTNTFSISDSVGIGQFWVSHTISGTGGQNWREIDSGGGGFDGIGDQQFYQMGGYSGTPTITPQHYGIIADGNSLNFDFELYSTTGSIYSSGNLLASTLDPNDSNYYYVAWTYTTTTSAGKIVRQSNGGGFTAGQFVSGTASGYDALGPAFADGPTVAPTSSPATDAYFENSSTDKTVPIVILNAADAAGVPSLEFRKNNGVLARLYSTGFNLTTDGAFTAATFSGNGAALTSLNGSNISTGTVATTVGGTGLTSYTLGDTLYSSASNTLAKLAGNTTTTKKFLRQTGTGSASTAPAWDTIVAGDIPTLNQNTSGSAATLTTGRTIAITGDLAYTSPSFNGSANVTAAGTLATVNGNVGSFTNANITVNAKGLVTAVSNGLSATVTTVTATNQSADITSTNFSNTSTAGLYRVSYSLEDTTSDVTAGAVTLTIAYTAAAGAITVPSAALVLTGVGLTQGTIFVQLSSGSISYSTSHTGLFGTARYALYMTVERLI